ncbi:hypothetical protein [Azospirillum sp. TSH58]|uniref:hypothetical protein n=1 Tax=Azospirillum sp. TSH58 TaxID=664962 RepID=UPI0011B26319|nr:hypothetical protein [Azospirillum sp. TSH58]
MALIKLTNEVYINIDAVGVVEFKVEKKDPNIIWSVIVKNHSGNVLYQKAYSANKNDNISISNIKKEFEEVQARVNGFSAQV